MNTTTSDIQHPTSDIDDLARYHRQMLLPGFGEEGQRKLLASKALIVGCGALGTVAANLLARAGVGELIIVDRDFIEATNLQRQVLFDENDVRDAIPKAEAAKRKINQINSQVKVTAIVDDLNHTNIEKLAEGCDVLVDGVDNFETRFIVNDAAVKLGIPYVYGGAVGTVGMQYTILPHTPAGDSPWEKVGKATPCLRCIFEQAPPPGMNPTCDTAGVLNTSVGIVATYEANEALKLLTGNWDAVSPTLLHIDTWHNLVKQFKVGKAYDLGECVCCKKRSFEFLDGKFGSSTTTLCGRNAVQLQQKESSGGKLDFDEIAGRLRSHGDVTANKFMLRANITDNGEPYELTLFTDGRAIVKGTQKPDVARGIYAKYVGA
ncbi:ThiF family adenylyltransferase [Phycisphaerales bacterium AB-hyl4]|uniref:ThiF family adenylyltransferase n=1 Tax=Natronomicrosphaera hydrolytica TaxID=3242702 RepID=A0ABV4U6J7_9BACT